MSIQWLSRNQILSRRWSGKELGDLSAVFNPGAIYFDEKFRLLVRVQTRGRETCLVRTESINGQDFRGHEPISRIRGIEDVASPLYHVYDPRLTDIDGVVYVTVAMDIGEGCQVGIARTNDFEDFEFLAIALDHDTRNAVLFPERIGGRYLMLSGPNRVHQTVGATDGDAVSLYESEDLLHWSKVGPVFRGRPHYWDELVGSGPPPVRMSEGWLHIYHGIATHVGSPDIYQAGAILLDPDDPTKVIARTRRNILEPREPWEMTGYVPNIVFPTGLVLQHQSPHSAAPEDAAAFIYYGAANTCVGLVTCRAGELVKACLED